MREGFLPESQEQRFESTLGILAITGLQDFERVFNLSIHPVHSPDETSRVHLL